MSLDLPLIYLQEIPVDLRFAPAAGAAQGFQQPIRMVDAFGITGDLCADHAGRIAVVPGSADPSDGGAIEDLNIEGAGGGAVMRTG